MEATAIEYAEDINTLTNQLNAMAKYMNQFDLAEIQAAIGDVNVAAFEKINPEQVCEMIADEQSQKAIQTYIAMVTEATKDVENGYQLHVNINPNEFMTDVAKKREELYTLIAAETDPSMLVFIDSYRFVEECKRAQEDENSYHQKSMRWQMADMFNDAITAQGIQKDVSLSNATHNLDAMLSGFEYAVHSGLTIDNQTMQDMTDQLYALMYGAAYNAWNSGQDGVSHLVDLSMIAYEHYEDAKQQHENLIGQQRELLEQYNAVEEPEKRQDLEMQLKHVELECETSKNVLDMATTNVHTIFRITFAITEEHDGELGIERAKTMILGYGKEGAEELFKQTLTEMSASKETVVDHAAANDASLEF